MKIKSQKGFTLIELLIVIAIIGILAAVLIPNLLSARNRGADAAVRANMSGLSANAALFYDTGSTFTGVCATTGTNTVGAQVLAAAQAGGTTTTTVTTAAAAPTTAIALSSTGTLAAGYCTVSSTGDAWFSIAPLKTGGAFCVDSTGNKKTITANSATVVAANTMVCS